MKYFISDPFTSLNVNQLGHSFNQWVKEWGSTLLANEDALTAFLDELQEVLDANNAEYKRCKPLVVKKYANPSKTTRLHLHILTEGSHPDSTAVARISIEKVFAEFDGQERIFKAKKGGCDE